MSTVRKVYLVLLVTQRSVTAGDLQVETKEFGNAKVLKCPKMLCKFKAFNLECS